MVTHHVEEVPARFHPRAAAAQGHRAGRGPGADVFTERNLSKCFGLPLIVEHRDLRWTARAVPLR